MKEISDFISSIGFPIVVSLLMIYQQQKVSDSYIEIVNSLKELVSDNTKSINLLISRARENDKKILTIMGGFNENENKQETSQPVPDNQ